MNPRNEAVEAVADLLMLKVIDHFHGKRAGDFNRRYLAHPFFESLRARPGGEYPKHNLRFVMLCYLPTRFGDSINQQFLTQWSKAWAALEPLGYTQEEAATALYSSLAETDLTWLFQLCDWELNSGRVQEGRQQLRERIHLESGRRNGT